MQSTAGEELQSAISSVTTVASGHPKSALLAGIASQFMAAIPENPESEDLADDFLSHSLAGQPRGSSPTSPELLSIVRDIRTSLLDGSDDVMAVAASPIRLTDFGAAANRTGFSPESCREIARFLRRPLTQDPSLPEIGSMMLQALGSLPEQDSEDLRKVVSLKTHRFCVKADDLQPLLGFWLEGRPEEFLFLSLPYVLRSTRRPSVDEWAKGQRGNWDSEYDGFMDLLNAVSQMYLPWLLRACNSLCPLIGGWCADIDWRLWAEFVEGGVDSRWALAALNAQATSNRRVAAEVGRAWPQEYTSEITPLGLEYLSDEVAAERIGRIFLDVHAQLGDMAVGDQADLAELYRWLQDKAGRRVPLALY
jgi:helicase